MRRLVGLVIALGVLTAPSLFAQVTPSTAAGVTVNDIGTPRRTLFKVTVNFAAFTCAATTCDITLGTIPAKTRLLGIVADVTQAFVCAAVCTTATLSVTAGKTAGGSEWLASFDADAAIARFGLLDAEMGTTMTRAAAINGGDMLSWTANTTAQIRMTSGTGNIGTGTATNFNAGSITFYLITEQFP